LDPRPWTTNYTSKTAAQALYVTLRKALLTSKNIILDLSQKLKISHPNYKKEIYMIKNSHFCSAIEKFTGSDYINQILKLEVNIGTTNERYKRN